MISKRSWRIIISVLLIVIFITLPRLIGKYHIYLLIEVFILAILTYSFNFLFSYAGLLSFGQASFYGIGAYTLAILFRDVTNSIYIAFLGAISLSGVAALIIGFFCVRLRRIYFAMLTVAFAQMIYSVIFTWRNFTGGDDGLTSVPRGALEFYFFKVSLLPLQNYYYFTFFMLILSTFMMWKLVHSNFGYTLRAIRDNEERAGFIGINSRRQALIAFFISGLFAGLAGALHASLARIANPEMAFWVTSFDAVLSSLLGGVYAFSGPLVGSFIFIFLKAYLMSLLGNWLLWMGIILTIIVIFFQSGIMGIISEKMGLEL